MIGCSETRMKSSMFTSIVLNTFYWHTNWFSEFFISLLLFVKPPKISSAFSFSFSSYFVSSISCYLNSINSFIVLNCLKKSNPLFFMKGLNWFTFIDSIILSDSKFLAVNVFIFKSDALGILCNEFLFSSHTLNSFDHSKFYYFRDS